MRSQFFASLAIASTLVACGISDEHFQQTVDSSNVLVDAPRDAGVDAGAIAMLSISQPTGDLSFGDVVMGQTSPTTAITVANNSDADSGTISIAFEDTLGFAIVGVTDACSDHIVAAHRTCTFSVDFAPTAAGMVSTTLHVIATPGGDLTKAVAANGITQGQIDIMEGSAEFGSVDIDATAATQTLTVRNLGQAAIGMPMPTTGGDASYSVQSTTCTAALAQAETCTITVAFDPSTVGQRAGSLTVTATPGGQDAAALSGTGTATVTVTPNGTGSGTVSSTQAGIDCGSSCTAEFSSSPVGLQASATVGSTFTGWGGDCPVGTGTCSLDLTGTKAVTATFDLEHFGLTITQAGTGSGTLATLVVPAGAPSTSCGPNCLSYPYDTKITLTPTASTGSTFANWSGDCSGSGACNVTLDQAHAVTATFTLDTFALTVTDAGAGSGSVTSSTGGIACGSACSATYNYNAMVTLTATPATGSTFTSWTGAPGCTTATTCTLTMTTAANVTATFAAGSYVLSVSVAASGTGAGAVTSADGNFNCSTTTACTHAYAFNAPIALTANPATGSHFDHWIGGGTCDGSTTATCAITMPAAATSAQAVFTLNPETLTVAINGTGSGSVSSSPAGIACGATCMATLAYNTPVTLTATPATGSTVSWAGCTPGVGNTCTLTLTAATTVTATFSAGPQTLTVATNGGNGTGSVSSSPAGIACGATCMASFPFNTSVTLTASPSAGASFAGWSLAACPGTSTCTVVMSQAQSVTASFAQGPQTFTLTQTGSGAGTLTISPNTGCVTSGLVTTCSFAYGTAVTVSESPGATSTFAGWTGECSSTGTTCGFAMTTTRALTASFSQITHQLQIQTNGGAGGGTIARNPTGTACPTGAQCFVYPAGTPITLTESPDGSSTFTGWSVTGCSGMTCPITLNADTTVIATFVPNYTLTVGASGGTGGGAVTSSAGGIDCVAGSTANCQATFASTAPSVTLTATAAPGSVFGGWGGACATSGTVATCVVTMSAAQSVTATFNAEYTIAWSVNGSGSVAQSASSIGACQSTSCTYLAGTVATLTAQPGPSSTFVGWSGVCAGQGPTCSITVGASATVNATFSTQYPLTVGVSGGGTVLATDSTINCGNGNTLCNASYIPNAAVTLNANAPNGTVFAGWGGACSGTGACTVTMSGALTVTASFDYDLNMNTLGGVGANTITATTAGGIACPIASGFTSCVAYPANTNVVMAESPAPGNSFTGWSGYCGGLTPCTVSMGAPHTVSANFAPTSYGLSVAMTSNNTTGTNTVTASGGTLTCTGGTCTGSAPYNGTVVLTAVPDSATGTFTSWTSGPCSGSSNPTCSFAMPAGNVSAGAQFDWFATMTILKNAGILGDSTIAASASSSDGGIACSNTTTLAGTCVSHPNHGTALTVTFSPAVLSWTLSCKVPNVLTKEGIGSCVPTCSVNTCTCTMTVSTPGAFTTGMDIGCGSSDTE